MKLSTLLFQNTWIHWDLRCCHQLLWIHPRSERHRTFIGASGQETFFCCRSWA